MKVKRVVRSTLAAEAISLNDGCDSAVYLSKLVIPTLLPQDGLKLDITAFTDNKSTFDAINSTTSVHDKKLRLEISALREYKEQGEIDIQWVSGKDNFSDVFTKRGANSRPLISALMRFNQHF